MSTAYNVLTSINFTSASITNLELDDDGNMEVTIKANYNYTVQYTNYTDEVKTHDDATYSRMKLTLSYDKGEYHLINAEDLEDYFSRY